MRLSISVLFSAVLLSAAALSGCGQRGPLYLPEDIAPKAPTVAPVTDAQPATAPSQTDAPSKTQP
jgi:predicted small lipoprotein YifL